MTIRDINVPVKRRKFRAELDAYIAEHPEAHSPGMVLYLVSQGYNPSQRCTIKACVKRLISVYGDEMGLPPEAWTEIIEIANDLPDMGDVPLNEQVKAASKCLEYDQSKPMQEVCLTGAVATLDVPIDIDSAARNNVKTILSDILG